MLAPAAKALDCFGRQVIEDTALSDQPPSSGQPAASKPKAIDPSASSIILVFIVDS